MVDPIAINADTGAPAYSAGEFRQGLALPLLYDGRPAGGRQGVRPGGTQLQVTLDGSDIKIAPGVCYIDPAWTSIQAGYWVAFPAELTRGPLQAADATNPRKDRVWARVWDDDEDTSGLRTADGEYQAGTPAATPIPPTVPQGAIPLALIDVPAQGGGAPVVTDERQFTAMAGGTLILPDQAARDALTAPYESLRVWRQDIAQEEVYDGADWGQIPSGLYAPRLLTHVRGATNVDTSTAEPVTLLTTNLALRSDTVYEIKGWARGRPINSADNGRTYTLILTVDSTDIQVGRATTNAVTNDTTDVTACHVCHPGFTPGSTATVAVALRAERAGSSWSGHLEIRGTGGSHFDYWLAVSVVGGPV